MSETLSTADGKPVPLAAADMEFAAAMAAPRADDPQFAPPPPVDPEAPHGRKADGTPYRSASGRRPRARVTDAEPAPSGNGAGKGAAADPADFTGRIGDFADGLWMLTAITPVKREDLRIRVRAQGAVIKANRDSLAAGINIMAQHSAPVRWTVEKLTGGDAGWILPAMFALLPMAVQSAGVWRAPVEGDLRALADKTDQDWAEMFTDLKAQLGIADPPPPDDPPAE